MFFSIFCIILHPAFFGFAFQLLKIYSFNNCATYLRSPSVNL